MNQSKNHTAKGVLLFAVASIGVSFLYQNCTQTDFYARNIEMVSAASTDGDEGSSGGAVDLERYVSAKSAGVMDDNCLTNSQYDACIFWKNPVAQNGAALSSFLTFGMDLSGLQKFGVQLDNLKSPQFLESDYLYVYTSNAQALSTDTTTIRTMPRLSLNNGQYRRSYSQDGGATAGEKATAQLMAYFWLNNMIQDFSHRVGSAFAGLQKITYVNAFADVPGNSSLKNNAYYTFRYNSTGITKQFIFMGYASKPSCQNATCHEMALSAEAYLHEMGHGNLYSAAGVQNMLSNSDIQLFEVQISKCTMETSSTSDDNKWLGDRVVTAADITQATQECDPHPDDGATDFSIAYFSTFCKTSNGCIDAISEGQADFHFLMTFPEKGQLGETIVNNIQGGLASYAASRDVTTAGALTRTVQTYYDQSSMPADPVSGLSKVGGEIHGMGSAYASILWAIYQDTRIDTRKFEKAFFLHLAKLGHSSDFTVAWDALRADYLVVGGDNAGLIAIDQVFTQKGVKTN